MTLLASRRMVLFAAIVCLTGGELLAAGGTSVIASKGQPAYVSEDWPEGVGEIVNDPARTFGWNSWFTEWPNDVNQYAFETATSDDLNRLIAKLAATKSELRQIRLCTLKEPNGLGWVSRVPEGNKIPVIFSVGNQAQIDRWYERVRKPFGVIEFTAAPVAIPPTLTIFVQNERVKLDELKIPEGISVSAGYVPTVFHRSNRKVLPVTKVDLPPPETSIKLDPDSQAAADKIAAFLKQRSATK